MPAENNFTQREQQLQRQNDELRARLKEAEGTLRANRKGEADAVGIAKELGDSLEQRVAERTAELRRSVHLLQGEQRRFSEVLDALPIYVILLTRDYRVSFANRFFEDRYGNDEGRRCYE